MNFDEEIMIDFDSIDKYDFRTVCLRHVNSLFTSRFSIYRSCSFSSGCAYRNVAFGRFLDNVAILITRWCSAVVWRVDWSGEIKETDIDTLTDRSLQTPRMWSRATARHRTDVSERGRTGYVLFVSGNRYNARSTFLNNYNTNNCYSFELAFTQSYQLLFAINIDMEPRSTCTCFNLWLNLDSHITAVVTHSSFPLSCKIHASGTARYSMRSNSADLVPLARRIRTVFRFSFVCSQLQPKLRIWLYFSFKLPTIKPLFLLNPML